MARSSTSRPKATRPDSSERMNGDGHRRWTSQEQPRGRNKFVRGLIITVINVRPVTVNRVSVSVMSEVQ